MIILSRTVASGGVPAAGEMIMIIIIAIIAILLVIAIAIQIVVMLVIVMLIMIINLIEIIAASKAQPGLTDRGAELLAAEA